MKGGWPRVVGTRCIFKGWNTFDIVTVEETDAAGAIHRHEREVIDHGDAAVVLTIDREREVALMVRQWRAPLVIDGGDPFLLEACAGIIDPGESAEETARREAEEELGIKVRGLRKLGSILPSAGALTERMHLFVADVSAEDRVVGGGGNPHEGERIETVEVPLAELYDMARRGAIEDAKTLVIVQRLMLEELDPRSR
jgi:nudix-type nucleoside diphosphatase (YffH/AdpP family)